MTKLFADNAVTTLASAASNGNTSLVLADGSKFPTPSSVDEFDITLTQADTETSWEVVTVTSRAGNTVYLKSPLQGTWNLGSKVEQRWTAAHAIVAANPAMCGTAILDFGAGANLAVATIMGQSSLGYSSLIDAWIMGVDTADHNYYEHIMAPIQVRAGNIVPGISFQIFGVSNITLTGQFAVQWVRTQ